MVKIDNNIRYRESDARIIIDKLPVNVDLLCDLDFEFDTVSFFDMNHDADYSAIVDVVNNIHDKIGKNINCGFLVTIDDYCDSIKENFMKVCDGLKYKDKFYVPVLGARSLSGIVEYYNVEHIQQVDDYIKLYGESLKNSNMSNFEKVMAAYMTTIKILPYQRSNEEYGFSASRNAYGVFESGTIVCEGYVDLFCKLLSSIPIENEILEVSVKSLVNQKDHVRLVVSIDDDKYDIHGNYIFDPTFDAQMYRESKKIIKEKNCNFPNDFLTSISYAFLNKDEVVKIFNNENNKNEKFYDVFANVSEYAISYDKFIDCLYTVLMNGSSFDISENEFKKACNLLLKYRGLIYDYEQIKLKKEILLEYIDNYVKNNFQRLKNKFKKDNDYYEISHDPENLVFNFDKIVNKFKQKSEINVEKIKILNELFDDNLYNLKKDRIIQDDLSVHGIKK